MEIDISRMNKADVLRALYNHAKAQGTGILIADREDMPYEEAKALLDNGQTYFDYVNGRVMKVDLSGDVLDPFLYDRDNGPDAANNALQTIEQKT